MAFDHAPGMTGGAIRRGLGNLKAALRGLPDALQKKVMQRAIQAATYLVRDDAAALVRVRTGETKESIQVGEAPWSRKSRTNVTYLVAAHSRTAHLLEFGVAPHVIAARSAASRAIEAYSESAEAYHKSRAEGDARRAALLLRGNPVASPVHHPGARAYPFMRPAFDRNADKCLAVITDHVQRGAQAYWDGKWHVSRRNIWISKRY